MSSEAPTRWVSIGPVSDLEFEPGCSVEIDGKEYAVFEHEGGYFALDGSCPHEGGALAEGYVEGDEVTCPWHGWRFSLATGQCSTAPEDSVCAYQARVTEGKLELGLPPQAG
ncbi:MAG: Rieske (2Fe-2S) protein [Planctomycetota bacterium]